MNINQIFLFIIILIVSNCGGVFSGELVQDQYDAAVKLIKELKDETVTEPCNYVQCTLDDPIYVKAIDFEYYGVNGNDITIQTDLMVFKNLTKLTIYGNGIRVGSSFLNNFYKLDNLIEFEIDTIVESMDNIALPKSLTTIKISSLGTKVPQSFFSIPNLYIQTPITGYKMVNIIDKCISTIQPLSVVLPISILGGLPQNFFYCYDQLSLLGLNIQNKWNSSINPDNKVFKFPKFLPTQISTLKINFASLDDTSYIPFTFEPTIKDIINLEALEISSKGFVMNNTLGYIEVKSKSVKFEGLYDTLFDMCNSENCFRNLIDSDGIWSSLDCNFNMSYINLSNFKSVTIYYNDFEQELPSSSNYYFTGKLDYRYSYLKGGIPQSFCRASGLTFSDVNFDGDVPTCIICQGGDYYYDTLLDNGAISFTNFDQFTEPSCQNFNIIIPDNVIVPTEGGYIEFDGNDLGLKYSENSPISAGLAITPIPNERVSLYFPSGTGADLSKTFYFQTQFNTQFQVLIKYSYEEPTITGYRPTSEGYMKILGSGLSYTDTNIFGINGEEQTGSKAVYNQSTTYSQISFQEGETFQVGAYIAGQVSTIVTFTFTPQALSITKDLIGLSTVGGKKEISGTFYQSDASKLLVLINGIQKCQVLSVNSSFITINYPSNKVKDYYGLFIIDTQTGIFDYTDSVEYVQYNPPLPPFVPDPSSSSSNSSDGSNSSSNSNDPSSSDDNVSSASVLNLSMLLIISTLSLLLL